MSLPYERITTVEQDGAGTIHELDFPSRGFLQKILITEVGGTQTFTVDVFNKNPDDFTVDDPEDSYVVCPQINVTSGKVKQFLDDVEFFNNDEKVSGRYSGKIYLRFNTITSGDFVVAVGGNHDLT